METMPQTPTNRNSIMAFLTNATCGEACWSACEEICRCSCGGKNHGCLKNVDGIKPARSCKLNGRFYELKGVTVNYTEACAWARDVNHAHPLITKGWNGEERQTFYYSTDIGAFARIKPASVQQKEKWPELEAYKNIPAYQSAYLLWEKVI